MYYLYDTTTNQVHGLSTNLADLQAYQQSGQAIVEQDPVSGYMADMTVVDGVVTGDNTNELRDEARLQRDRLLAETDWWAMSDRTMTQAQIDYRQALRDLTAQEGFPSSITWPTKP